MLSCVTLQGVSIENFLGYTCRHICIYVCVYYGAFGWLFQGVCFFIISGLHTNYSLMEELIACKKAVGKVIPGAPSVSQTLGILPLFLSILVLDQGITSGTCNRIQSQTFAIIGMLCNIWQLMNSCTT